MAFYVTVKDRERTGFLVGPYNTHGAALANVDAARRAAAEVNSDAHWYSYGTCRLKRSRKRKGILNDRVGYTADTRP